MKIFTIIIACLIILPLANATDTKEIIDHVYCIRAVDGDTLIVKINGKKERVRLIGVDTPETKHPKKPVEYFGKEASDFAKNSVAKKKVYLKYDWQKRDKYKRLLAYVYRAEDQ